MTFRMHRAAVALAPIIMGALVTLVQGTTVRHIDPWVIGTALSSGTLTAFLNYVRGASDLPAAKP